MKKYILVFLILFTPCVTHAITMCARNDTLVGSLMPKTNGNQASSATESLWRTTYNYGILFGESTCLSEMEGGNNESVPNSMLKGLVGEDESGNPRIYCHCRMTHPLASSWVKTNTFGDYIKCADSCAGNCAFGAAYYEAVRLQLFRSVFDTLADEDQDK